jgi:uncharacterized protein YcbK (DUF882 family)
MDRVSENLLSGVNPDLARGVRNMAATLSARGIEIKVTSGKRSTERQAALYANRANNPYPVARPGTSKHELGLAVDLVPTGARSSRISAAIGETGEAQGLRWGGRFSKPDAVHFELPNGGSELVLDGSNVIAQAKEQATGVRVIAAFGIAALVIRFLRS